jgi:hypothetical protein
MMMDGRSIAKMLAKIRPHRFQNLRKDGSGGIVV